jgi:hypothetical protein
VCVCVCGRVILSFCVVTIVKACRSSENGAGLTSIETLVGGAIGIGRRHSTTPSCRCSTKVCRLLLLLLLLLCYCDANIVSVVVRPGTDRVSCLTQLKAVFGKLPDLERGLCRVYHRSATPAAFCQLMAALNKVLAALPSGSALLLFCCSDIFIHSIEFVAADAQRQFGDSSMLVALLDCRGNGNVILFFVFSRYPTIIVCVLSFVLRYD